MWIFENACHVFLTFKENRKLARLSVELYMTVREEHW